jgi:hypothetical protein
MREGANGEGMPAPDGWTSISVRSEVRNMLRERKADSEPWSEFMQRLLYEHDPSVGRDTINEQSRDQTGQE